MAFESISLTEINDRAVKSAGQNQTANDYVQACLIVHFLQNKFMVNSQEWQDEG